MQQRAEAVREMNEIANDLAEWAPQVVQTFQDRWADATPEVWARLAQEDPNQYVSLKAQYDLEREQAGRLNAEAARAQEKAHRAFMAEEAQRLPELAPELVDPKNGPARRAAVAEFLLSNGIQPEALRNASAAELAIASLALDGLKFREAQTKARAKASTTPRDTPAPTRLAKPIAPAPATGIPSKARALQGFETRLSKSGSLDDAVSLLLARSTVRK